MLEPPIAAAVETIDCVRQTRVLDRCLASNAEQTNARFSARRGIATCATMPGGDAAGATGAHVGSDRVSRAADRIGTRSGRDRDRDVVDVQVGALDLAGAATAGGPLLRHVDARCRHLAAGDGV